MTEYNIDIFAVAKTLNNKSMTHVFAYGVGRSISVFDYFTYLAKKHCSWVLSDASDNTHQIVTDLVQTFCEQHNIYLRITFYDETLGDFAIAREVVDAIEKVDEKQFMILGPIMAV